MKLARLGLSLVLLALLACKEEESPREQNPEDTGRISTAILFTGGDVEDGPLPDATDDSVSILPLEPAVLASPGDTTIMALEVDDPEEREVAAVLLQFEEDDDSHQRVPVEEGGGSSVETELNLADELCNDRCNVAFVVVLYEAVELSDGSISRSTERQLIIDCREEGKASACEEGEKDEESSKSELLLCGDVTQGETVLSGDSLVDAHLDAVRQLSSAIDRRKQELEMATQEIAEAIDVAGDSSSSSVGAALGARVDEQTDAGLMLQLGDRGCAIQLLRVSHALRACDPTGGGELGALQCNAVCEPLPKQTCDGSDAQGCRGILVDGDCQGQCTGACEVVLDSPETCTGTCNGTCDGECVNGDPEDCAGPCTGLCEGTCRAVNNGTCAGSCTGLCVAETDEAPECDPPLRAYCGAVDMDSAIACTGDCFGESSVDSGDETCQDTALAVGEIAPRCEPPLVQLAFGFAEGLSADEQNALVELVDGLNAPIGSLVNEGARLDLLAEAAMSLLEGAQGAVLDHLNDAIDENETAGLTCAQDRLPDTTSWIEEQLEVIEELRADVTALMAAFTVAE